MFLEILLAIACGVTAGVFTGLIPGVHVNLVCVVLLGLAPSMSFFSPLALSILIVSLATTHSFLDVLPSIFLGVPEASTALGVLPGHRYVLKGWGLMAVKLTLVGSLGALILSGLLFFLFRAVLVVVYPFVQQTIIFLLVAVVLFMVVRDRRPLWFLFVFFLSGCLGATVFAHPTLQNPLFPLLSGLFGVATMLVSLQSSSLPPQVSFPYTELQPRAFKALFSGTFAGGLTAVLPGVGAGTAAVIGMQITRDIGDHGFMVLLGGISTANFVLSLAALEALGKARNGALVAVSSLVGEVSLPFALSLLAASFVAGGLASLLLLFLGRAFSSLLRRLPYRPTVIGIIVFLVVLTPVLSGWTGLLVLVTATAVGLVPALVKVSRTAAMGCLLIPVILYFL